MLSGGRILWLLCPLFAFADVEADLLAGFELVVDPVYLGYAALRLGLESRSSSEATLNVLIR